MREFRSEVTRRTALTALGAGAAVSLAAPAMGAPTAAGQASLEQAIEALRMAMVAGDGKALYVLLHDRLVYMHSSGHSQTKGDLLGDLAGKRFFASLTYKDQVVDVVASTGMVKQTVDQVKNLPDGTTRASQIKVLQTWVQAGSSWQLLTRCSAIIYSPLNERACPDPVRRPSS